VLETILEADTQFFLWLNGHHSPALDPVMMALTQTVTWTPLYAVLFYFVVRKFKWQSWRALLAVACTLLLSDQITSSVMKPFFERLRPSHEPALAGLVHIVDGYRGGLFGFASGHAANSFGLATVVWLLLRTSLSWIWILFFWAALFTYTRIYLGVHYPGDVAAGAAVGMAGASVSFYFYKRYLSRFKEGQPRS
jgi:undecaprenyl-diphosphatase